MSKVKDFIRFCRVEEVYFVCVCYEQFKMMMIHRVLSIDGGFHYNEASNFSSAMNEIFGMESKVDDFLVNKDSEMNKSIEFYNNFKKIVVEAELDYDEMLACCKAIYYNKTFSWINSDGYIYMPIYLENFFLYINGNISKEEMKRRFVYFKLWEKGKPTKGNFALVRRTFREVENIISEVKAKRLKRERKKKREEGKK